MLLRASGCLPNLLYFGRANFTAGDGLYRDDINPSMDIVELMIDGRSGSGGADCCCFMMTQYSPKCKGPEGG